MATGLWRQVEEHPVMTLSLFECLKLVGLQRLHERFTSMGIHHAACLVALASEDLPLLEIHTAEDKSRLFKLVHLLRTLEQEGLRLGEVADDQETSRKRPAQHGNHRALAISARPDITKRLSMYNTYSTPQAQRNIAPHRRQHQHPRPNVAAKRCTNTANHPMPVYEAKRKPGYNYGLPLQPVSAKKQTRGLRIIVCVRKRPLTHAERRKGEADVVITPSAECVIVEEGKEAVDLTRYILQHPFYFDQVFAEYHSNEEVYKKTAYPLVQHMLNGGKATCFAFGQTGAGKTHTMMGSTPGEVGLYVLAVQDIFAHLSATCSPLLVYVSFCEIYCRQLYDLLNNRKRLFVREDGHSVVHIAGLCDVRVDSVNSLLKVISQGLAARTKRVSGINPLSSRSHALLQIQLRSPNQQIVGRMWFIDLAGSERASDTTATDWQTRMEGAEINQSLLALKECIRSLDQEQRHTPFRQSKLTQVLKDSFIGNSMTCMIANISPSHVATEHTLNTLRYADRVKELRGRSGGQECNATSSSKCSSVGKSLPKKPKMAMPNASFAAVAPTPRKPTGRAVNCSTPKSSRYGEGRAARAKLDIGIEEVGNSLVKGDGGHGCNKENGSANTSRKEGLSEGSQNERLEESTEADGDDAVTVDEEMQQHLRHYHRQLQMFVPFSVSPPCSDRRSLCSSASSAGHLAFSGRHGSKDATTEYDSRVESSESLVEDRQQRVEMRWLTNLEQADVAVDVAVNSGENGEDSLEMDPSLDGLWTDCLMSVHKTICGSSPVEQQHQERQSDHHFVSACEHKSVVQTPQEREKLPRVLQNTQVCKHLEVHKQSEDKAKMSKDNTSSDSRLEGTTALLVQGDQTNSQLCTLGREKEPLTHAKNKDREFNLRSSSSDTKVANKYTKEIIYAKDEDRESCLPKDLQSPISNAKWANNCTKEPLTLLKNKDREFSLRSPTSDTKLANKYMIKEHHTHAKDEDADLCLSMDLQSPTSAGKLAKRHTKECLTHAKNKDDEIYQRSPTSDTKLTSKCMWGQLTHAKDDEEVCLPINIRSPTTDVKYTMKEHLTHAKNKDQEFFFLSLTSDVKLAKQYIVTEHLTHAADEDSDLCLPKDSRSPTSDAIHLTELTQETSCAPKKTISPSSTKSETAAPNLPCKSLKLQMDGPAELQCKERPSNPEFSLTIDHAKWRVIQAHWEKLRKMEPLLREEQTLLCKQPYMAFVDYVDKLEEILDRNAQCLRSMRTKLRLYRMTSSFSEPEHKQAEHSIKPLA
ncbi:kinesin heavy chain-like isoform X1 [Phycodurus eques]|uniref:kinesin heavy chain-like isoform X1 n=1 Tax=Phycodurus eques TaxID=693459 RepID=UPI002ACE867E|nr:kinesin heavy chain-like isoform X1 [Phycodurus eques]XP_061527787.1 kinesin heavy chain-like isoform X1 [Phycodurus eques]